MAMGDGDIQHARVDHVPGFPSERLERYLHRALTLPIRDTLVRALEHIPQAGVASDLGCGPGKEVAELLRRGWRVEAVDAYARMLEATQVAAIEAVGAKETAARLCCVHTHLAQWSAPARSLDLIHAGFSLPFVAAAEFAQVWKSMCSALKPGGFFVGQLFGHHDSFLSESPVGSMNAHTHAEVVKLCGDFQVIFMTEEERDGVVGVPPNEHPKHWHVFHIAARRI